MLLAIVFCRSNGQNISDRLELDNVIAKFDSKAYLFSTNLNSLETGFEFPKGSGNSTIFASSYWLTGIDSSTNALHSSFKTYPNSFDCFFAGPARNPPYNDQSRNGIFKISKSTVIDFNQNFGMPGYVIPSSIINWPGNGNVNSGMSKKLAPFFDLNNNGNYESIQNGDFPLALGTENLYFLNNDISGNRTGLNPSVPGLNIEIRTYAYVLEDEYDAFKDCVFLNVVLKNRSQIKYKDVYFGLWFDFDIGGGSDDYIGCDSALNVFYAYNADNSDNDYGNFIPAQGLMLLINNFNSFIGYNNSINSINGNPQNPIEANNYLHGLWKNGNKISQTGNGTDTINTTYTKFLFNNGVNQESGPGYDKRALGSIGPFSLSPNESECFDLVVFPALDTISPIAYSSVTQLLNKADTIKKLFDVVGQGCTSPLISGIENWNENHEMNHVSIYPNPSSDWVNILSEDTFTYWSLKLFAAMEGKEIYHATGTGTISLAINLNSYRKGLYILQIHTNLFSNNFKILIYE
ncbi:T9SS type A sorting domain-containing protein [Hyphobacterium sp. CCMP332]|nr:T9SS type A sorting domain-containing protein [Hyphobacterium sp. CCMP332]